MAISVWLVYSVNKYAGQQNNGATSVQEALVPQILAASPPIWLLF